MSLDGRKTGLEKLWRETGSLYGPGYDERELRDLLEESGLDPDDSMRPEDMLVSSQYGAFETNIPGFRDLRSRAELWLLAALRRAPLDGVERLAVWARARSMAPAEVARAAVTVRR